MKTDILLDQWETDLVRLHGIVEIDAEHLKLFISRIKALETALADRLRLEYGRFEECTVGA